MMNVLCLIKNHLFLRLTMRRFLIPILATVLSFFSFAEDIPMTFCGVRLGQKLPEGIELTSKPEICYICMFPAKETILDYKEYYLGASLATKTVTTAAALYETQSSSSAESLFRRTCEWLEKKYPGKKCESANVPNCTTAKIMWFGSEKEGWYTVERHQPKAGVHNVVITLYNYKMLKLQETEAQRCDKGAVGGQVEESVTNGMTRTAVIAMLGAPSGSMGAGKRETLIFEKGKVVLVEGKVSDVVLYSKEEIEQRKKTLESSAKNQQGVVPITPSSKRFTDGGKETVAIDYSEITPNDMSANAQNLNLTKIPVYSTKITKNVNDTLVLANGGIVTISLGYLGYLGFQADAVLFRDGSNWKIWIKGKKTFNCDILKSPSVAATENGESVFIAEVKKNGKILKMLNGDVYMVGDFNHIDTMLWLGSSDALLIDGKRLINFDAADAIIEVTKLN